MDRINSFVLIHQKLANGYINVSKVYQANINNSYIQWTIYESSACMTSISMDIAALKANEL